MARAKPELQPRGIASGAEDSPHIRDLFHQKYRGSRYSLGYPACPHLEDQTKLFALLKPQENVGVRLRSVFLLAAKHFLDCGASSGSEVFVVKSRSSALTRTLVRIVIGNDSITRRL